MIRCIAILTLAMAAYADEANAQVPVETTTSNVSHADTDGGGATDALWFQEDGDGNGLGDALSDWSEISGDDDDVQWVTQSPLNTLIAIIAFEYGPEAAAKMLVDMGFSPVVADDMVWEAAIAIYGVRRYLAS